MLETLMFLLKKSANSVFQKTIILVLPGMNNSISCILESLYFCPVQCISNQFVPKLS